MLAIFRPDVDHASNLLGAVFLGEERVFGNRTKPDLPGALLKNIEDVGGTVVPAVGLGSRFISRISRCIATFIAHSIM